MPRCASSLSSSSLSSLELESIRVKLPKQSCIFFFFVYCIAVDIIGWPIEAPPTTGKLFPFGLAPFGQEHTATAHVGVVYFNQKVWRMPNSPNVYILYGERTQHYFPTGFFNKIHVFLFLIE